MQQVRIFSNASNCEKANLSENYFSDRENKYSQIRKGWANPVPAAAVIPVAQMMIYTRSKTCVAGLEVFFL